MNVLAVNDLAMDLVARDFSGGPVRPPNNAGPTKTARAMAIIHLAAHDAFAKLSGTPTQMPTVPAPPGDLAAADATAALLGAGFRAARVLYPSLASFVDEQAVRAFAGASATGLRYGAQVADAWLAARAMDGSERPDLDANFDPRPGRHRPNPGDPGQGTLGRTWGAVKPFALTSVAADAPLRAPPALDSKKYGEAYDQVYDQGRDDIARRDAAYRRRATIGLFWAYDGANLLGTPPRLYNQVVRAAADFRALPHARQVSVLAAINMAMADAGIAAWHWKYVYDVWRPVVGIREADAGYGPTGRGDGNAHRAEEGNPYWLPFGAPRSNALGSNVTPNFPAYPSGHATFGAACFATFAALLDKPLAELSVTFVSDELNGTTTDNAGYARPRCEHTFTLEEAIQQNNESRIWLGVHWLFDATGGETVGRAVAKKAALAFGAAKAGGASAASATPRRARRN